MMLPRSNALTFPLFLLLSSILLKNVVISQDSGVPSYVAIGVYQEMRSLPDNLISWKKYIIDPFIKAGSIVHIYFSIRMLSSHDPAVLIKSLKAANLFKYTIAKDFYHHTDDEAFIKLMRERYVKHEEGDYTSPDDCYPDEANPIEPLLVQYHARLKIGHMIMDYLDEYPYNIIMYLRSDLTFRFPNDSSDEENISVENMVKPKILHLQHTNGLNKLNEQKTSQLFVLLDYLQNHNYSRRIGWASEKEDYCGLNDRYLILTQPSFIDYHSNLKKRLIAYFARKGFVQGELINKNMVTLSTDEIKRIWSCYGVRRNIPSKDCGWTGYGDETCLAMGLRPLSAVFGEAWLTDTKEGFRAIEHCMYSNYVEMEHSQY